MKSFFIVVSLFLAACDASAAERTIEAETTVKATPAEAFRAWTTTEGIKTFFAPGGVIEPKSMGLYEIHMNPLATPGQRGADDMRILALQPDRMVTFTWNAPPSFPEVRQQRTLVIVRFAANGEGSTRISLTQVGWGEGGELDKVYDYFTKAWPYVLANCKKRFEQGPLDWTASLERVKAATAAAAAAEKK